VSKSRSDFLAAALFCVALVLAAFAYGVAVGWRHIFPYAMLTEAFGYVKQVGGTISNEWSWLYIPTKEVRKIPTHVPGAAYPGLNLVTAVVADNHLGAYIMDMDGRILHSWDVDWFKIWPDARHLPEDATPQAPPGTHIHGAVVLDDGDLVYNYEHLGMVRLDLCGNVVWRLPYRTHHSIHPDDDGDLWVSAQINHTSADPRFPNYRPDFIEPIVLKVSPDGKIKNEISVLELLHSNDLNGLLLITSRDNFDTSVRGDTLHLNDVEPFPASMPPGAFSPGDLLISLRNINAVLVFNAATGRVKQVWSGSFVRQHDPDFVDGDTVSVFDNNNVAPEQAGQQSRILLLTAGSAEQTIYYTGQSDAPFYSDIMGKHQWLPNGNLLITESMKGRAFEIDRDRRVVWEYFNLVGDGHVGLLEEVQRLPERMNDVYSTANVSAKCTGAPDRPGTATRP